MKLSEQARKLHKQAMELVESNKPLSDEEKVFILENYQESANHMNGEHGAYFTPYGLAIDLSCCIPNGATIVDLCAGIGALSYAVSRHSDPKKLVCVELNPDYVKVGKRILPEATWITGDALTTEFDEIFHVAISNPPFGRIKTSTYKGNYTGSNFEHKLIERAKEIACYGVFIIPQNSAGFMYSGQKHGFKECPEQIAKFTEQTGITLELPVSIDTAIYLDEWKGVSPMCEIVSADFAPSIKKHPNYKGAVAVEPVLTAEVDEVQEPETAIVLEYDESLQTHEGQLPAPPVAIHLVDVVEPEKTIAAEVPAKTKTKTKKQDKQTDIYSLNYDLFAF